MFGRLTWDAIPFHEPIPLITSLVVILAVAGDRASGSRRKGWWPYLWHEYITSTDHKRIGIMYIVLALVMLVRGFADAIMMRAQQSLAIGASQGYLPPEHYNQIFSAHGTIMIFFVAMPFVIGFMNFVVPLQLGVRDVAFPTHEQRQLLADRVGRAAGQPQPVRRRVRAHRLARLPAAQREGVLARRRGRLLSRRAADIRRRDGADRRQFRDDHPQDPRAGHELPADAGILLDVARIQPDHPRRLPGADRHLGAADARPLPRLPLLHE